LNALLDTHTLLWWLTDDRRLSRGARSAIAAGDLYVSVVSLWEIEIKRSLGRIEADTKSIVAEVASTDGFHLLDIRPSHIVTLTDLPPVHQDPFDRMLVAQALREHVVIVTRDHAIRRYPVEVRW
jgi:PIN domain nuclease of toxin-antitoxin system